MWYEVYDRVTFFFSFWYIPQAFLKLSSIFSVIFAYCFFPWTLEFLQTKDKLRL